MTERENFSLPTRRILENLNQVESSEEILALTRTILKKALREHVLQGVVFYTEDELVTNAGDLLRIIREKNNLTQEDLFYIADIQTTVICEIEGGSRLLSPKYIERLEESRRFSDKEIHTLRLQAAVDYLEEKFKINVEKI